MPCLFDVRTQVLAHTSLWSPCTPGLMIRPLYCEQPPEVFLLPRLYVTLEDKKLVLDQDQKLVAIPP